MGDDIKDKVINAIGKEASGLVKDVYKDGLKPAVSAIGKTLGGTVRIALAPLNGIVWGYDKIAEWLEKRIEDKLAGTHPDDIVTPPISIIGPSIEALRFLADEPGLREMFASLIAKGFVRDQVNYLHPGFVQIIKELTSNDALILKYLNEYRYIAGIDLLNTPKGTTNVEVTSWFISNAPEEIRQLMDTHSSPVIDNLVRLRLIEVKENCAPDLRMFRHVRETEKYISNYIQTTESQETSERCYYCFLTAFGENFCRCCLEN